VSIVLLHNAAFPADVICIQVLGLRDPGLAVIAPNLMYFGPMENDCRVPGFEKKSIATNNTLCTFFTKQIFINGYYFVTSDGPVDMDPVRWSVLASADNQSTWTLVGASVWKMFGDGTIGLYDQLPFFTTTDRRAEVKHDLRPTWPWVLDWLFCFIVNALGYFSCFVAAINGWSKLVKTIWIAFCLTVAIIFLFAAIGYYAAGNSRAAATCLLEMVPQLVFVLGISFYESKIIHLLLVCSLCFAVSLLIDNVVIYSSSWVSTIPSIIQSAGTAAFIFAIIVSCFRRRALRRSGKLVTADKERYDQVWLSLINNEPHHQNILMKIRNEAWFSMNDCNMVVPRQYSRKFARKNLSMAEVPFEILTTSNISNSTIWSMFQKTDEEKSLSELLDSQRWLPGSLDYDNPVKSLDQLFVQASCLHPILLQKVKTWAKASGGCFLCKGSSGFIKIADLPEDSLSSVRWAKIKSMSRAVEKVYRIYGKVLFSWLVFECTTG
jgi:hypothetical protein